MKLNARLQQLAISTPQPERLAAFYCDVFGYRALRLGNDYLCEGPGRSLRLCEGASNQLQEARFLVEDPRMLPGLSRALAARAEAHEYDAKSEGPRLLLTDPEGRKLCLSAGAIGESVPDAPSATPPARLQHYAVRTPAPEALTKYYSEVLGFRVSDLVRNDQGELTAAFLRTDAEHHVLAIFRASQVQLDHFSCETRDWHALRDWADHMAARSVGLAWGVGRHGPGNDTFFMVRDPDGNLVEISSDLELCADDRPAGQWAHRQETLNRWGQAIMRS